MFPECVSVAFVMNAVFTAVELVGTWFESFSQTAIILDWFQGQGLLKFVFVGRK